VALNIIVLAKQVIDPEMPRSAFTVDRENRRIVTPNSIPPVVNGFDENAVEAALRIKDKQEATVTVISMGQTFDLNIMKKPLSMGADTLVLLEDQAFENNLDGSQAANVLAAAVKKLGEFDLIICGRQASDWDNAQVPLAVAETLDLPCITIGKNVEVAEGRVIVKKQVSQGVEIMEAPLPAIVTVSNELGQPRYPTLRGIMAATRKQPIVWSAQDLGVNLYQTQSHLELIDLYTPTSDKECEIVQGEDDADSGRMLALKLREAKLI
jgi:electron transfer flavoprotein beta subunit